MPVPLGKPRPRNKKGYVINIITSTKKGGCLICLVMNFEKDHN